MWWRAAVAPAARRSHSGAVISSGCMGIGPTWRGHTPRGVPHFARDGMKR